MTDTLERELRELRVAWPQTPDIATAVRPGLQAPARPPRRRVARWAAAIAVALLGAAMAIEPARSAILDVLGIGGARIERRAPQATPSPQPPRARLGEGLDLGRPVTPAAARRLAGFTPAPPTALAAPDGVFFADGPPDGGRVSYVYRAGPGLPRSDETGAGLLVQQARAAVAPFIEKAAGPGTRVERLSIDGDRAFFLSGERHGIAYGLARSGEVYFTPERLAGNTLLVERGGLLLRIEGRIGRDRAIAIARSTAATSRRRAS